jgi:hypothetical protein
MFYKITLFQDVVKIVAPDFLTLNLKCTLASQLASQLPKLQKP